MATNDRERCCCFCDALDWHEAVAVLAEGAFLPKTLAWVEEEEEALLHRGIARGAVRESIVVYVVVQYPRFDQSVIRRSSPSIEMKSTLATCLLLIPMYGRRRKVQSQLTSR